MGNISINLNEEQYSIFENMFEGDSKRDASDKVRGFIYQDYVALDFLLDDNTECVCLEYIEDVDVFCNNGTFKFIQVKYYPKKRPDMKEIMTDLYYQYLRLHLLGSELIAKPTIVIHRKEKIDIPDLEKMKEYIKDYSFQKRDAKNDPKKWLKDNIHKLKKVEQKKTLFKEEAYEGSIKEFLEVAELIKSPTICDYQMELEKRLEDVFEDADSILEAENRNKILFGLAINYLQLRYTLVKPLFQEVRVTRDDFINYVNEKMEVTSDSQTAAYLFSVVIEHYADILRDNSGIEDEQKNILNEIVRNTQSWLFELGSKVEGQFQIVNTLSRESFEKLAKFREEKPIKRLKMIIKCEESIEGFLDYLWKIMYDLCIEKKSFSLKENHNMTEPQYYIDSSIKNYICLKFEQDYVQTSAILPFARRGHIDGDLKNICSRMIKQKPQKWLMENADSGKYEYSYNTAHIKDTESITNIEDDSFYIECMECIKVDKEKWHQLDKCTDCIFSEKCVAEGRK